MSRSSLILLAGLVIGSGSLAAADPVKKAAAKADTSSPRRNSSDKGTMKQCSETDGKKSCKRVAVFQGHNAAKSTLRADPLDKPSGEVWVRAENLNEEFKGNIYKKDGTFDDAALAKLDDLWRDTTSGDVRAVRAELYEHLSRICDHYPGKRVDMVSGFRFHERDSSRHFHASAMDIRIPSVSIRDMYNFAETLDTGEGGALGVGIYPNSQFIHVDFRAPGEPSFRWTDYSGHSNKSKSSPARTQPARKPVS